MQKGELGFGLQNVENHSIEATYNTQPPACHEDGRENRKEADVVVARLEIMALTRLQVK